MDLLRMPRRPAVRQVYEMPPAYYDVTDDVGHPVLVISVDRGDSHGDDRDSHYQPPREGQQRDSASGTARTRPDELWAGGAWQFPKSGAVPRVRRAGRIAPRRTR